MKKYLSLALVLLLVFSIATSTAFAADIDSANTRRDTCHHNSLRPIIETTYYANGSTQHRVEISRYYHCLNCDHAIPGSEETKYEPHSPTGGVHVSSNHSGKYSMHYCTYNGYCSKCLYNLTWTQSTGCTATQCFDPT